MVKKGRPPRQQDLQTSSRAKQGKRKKVVHATPRHTRPDAIKIRASVEIAYEDILKKTITIGRVVLDAFVTLELEIANNTRTRPTYAKGGKSTIVDLTFVDPSLIGDRLNWKRSLHGQ